jgi:hypothetical protein
VIFRPHDQLLAIIPSPQRLVALFASCDLELLYEIGKPCIGAPDYLRVLAAWIALQNCGNEFQEVVQRPMQQTRTRYPFDRMITAHAAMKESDLVTKGWIFVTITPEPSGTLDQRKLAILCK